MILYLDTSALVKLYIDEPNREQVMHAVKNAKVVASHKIGFVEVHATFARLQRESRLTLKDLQITKDSFSNDWKDYMQISISDSLLQQAADFTEAFSLRAYDSVHLAAADDLQKQSNTKVTFACFDHKLNQAAKIIGLALI
jgi:predicted nucleic acid-binding protein